MIIWEMIHKNDALTCWTMRAKVIGGWIVKHKDSTGYQEVSTSMIFIPDYEHRWEIE